MYSLKYQPILQHPRSALGSSIGKEARAVNEGN